MTTVGITTGAGRGMGLACARRLVSLVDRLLLVDLDEAAVTTAAKEFAASGHGAVAEPFVLDITDRDGLARLTGHVAELGTLRAVAHAAGISPPWPAGAASSPSTSSGPRCSPRLSARSPPRGQP